MPAIKGAISISQTKHSVNKMPGYLGDLGQQIQIFTAGRMKVETSTATLSQGRMRQREAHLFSVSVTQCNERDNFVISSDSIHQSCTLHRATVHLMVSLNHFSFPPDTTKERKKVSALSYEILPNPHDAPDRVIPIWRFPLKNNFSNKWKTYPLTDLSWDLTFQAQPQQKQKDEAEACGGSAAVCLSTDFGRTARTSQTLTGLLF